MQKRAELVSAAVAVLGLASGVLGLVAAKKSEGFVVSSDADGQRCVYRRSPGLGCGVAVALLSLTGLLLATACLGRDAPAPPTLTATGLSRVVERKLKAAWPAEVSAVAMFLYGAAMKRGFWSSRQSRSIFSGCTDLKAGCFFLASILSVIATWFAIDAVYSQRTDEPAPAPAPGQFVAMGQPQYPPPMANNPAPPQYGHGGYGPRQPAGTAA